MTWLAWRRQRAQIVTCTVVGLGIVIAFPLMMGNLEHTWTALLACGTATCREIQGVQFTNAVRYYSYLKIALIAIPALLSGLVFSQVLLGDTWNNMHRWVWSFGVSRRHWFVSRALPPVLALLIGYGCLAVETINVPPTQYDGSWANAPFMQAWLLWCAAIGMYCGLITRRSVVAAVSAISAAAASFLVLFWTLVLLFWPVRASPGHPPEGIVVIENDSGLYFEPYTRFWPWQFTASAILVCSTLIVLALVRARIHADADS